MFSRRTERDYILISAQTSRGIDLSYRIGLFAQQWNFTSLLGKSRDTVTRKFTQPRGSLLHELLPTVPPALRLRFAETLTNFFSSLFTFPWWKGREGIGREEEPIIPWIALGLRSDGESGEWRGGKEGGIIWKIGDKESGRAVSCVIGVVTIVNLWTSYRK